MPPPLPTTVSRCTRTVRIAGAQCGSRERLRLLTYKMALAQPHATVPLLQHHHHTPRAHEHTTRPPSSLAPASSASDTAASAFASTSDVLAQPRRWVREADELCVASIRRSTNINHINSYVATYKLDHPHWRDLLLPQVTVLPRPDKSSNNNSNNDDVKTATSAGTTPPHADAPADTPAGDAYDVYIDYSKLTSLELMSRHVNYALRHIVQKGHALYLVHCAQHSVLHMRGMVEASYVTCAYGVRGERLRTYITHVGPLDVRDVVSINRTTHAVQFDLHKPHVRRGVVALSQVEGYGTWFQRKPMLWQRTRRIGALQSQMGAYAYDLAPPPLVGRVHACEVALLAPHLRCYGGSGVDAVGLIASSQVAQNARLYMGQFEAPAIAAVDAVQQLAHYAALRYKLLRPVHAVTSPTCATTAAACGDARDLDELRRRHGMERLLPVSWMTRTPPPYVPLEADLPFRLQLSRPAVFGRGGSKSKSSSASTSTRDNDDDDDDEAVVYPTGGTVGSPFVGHVPLSMFEYHVHQGVDHYIFDDAPSSRPLKWWSQKSNMPYSGYMYCMRSGLLDVVRPVEQVANPLASLHRHTARSVVAHDDGGNDDKSSRSSRSVDAMTVATSEQRRGGQRRRRRLSMRRQAQLQRRHSMRRRAALVERLTAAAHSDTQQQSQQPHEAADDACAADNNNNDDDDAMPTREVWRDDTCELHGHDVDTRAHTALQHAAVAATTDDDDNNVDDADARRVRAVLRRANEQRRPTYQLLPPSATAARRHAQLRAAVAASAAAAPDDNTDATSATRRRRSGGAAARLRARIAARLASGATRDGHDADAKRTHDDTTASRRGE